TCTGYYHFDTSFSGALRILHHAYGCTVRRYDGQLKRNIKLLQHIGCGLYHREIAVAAHDDADKGSLLFWVFSFELLPAAVFISHLAGGVKIFFQIRISSNFRTVAMN